MTDGSEANSPERRYGHRDTPTPHKVVVVLLRTMTSALRVCEALDLVFGDAYRIRLVYAFDEGSAYNGWLTQWLVEEQRQVLNPQQLKELKKDHKYDLVVAASENADLRGWSGPIVILPHGLGYHKMVPSPTGEHSVLSGLVPAAMLRTGQVTLVITHPDQARQLCKASPDTAGHTELTGDIGLAILRASNQPHRINRYRKNLRTGRRTLVVVMTTWGEDSVLGAEPDLLTQLMGTLPADEYQIALVAHCNIWSRDGAAEMKRKLERPIEAGLLLIEPKYWHAALLAADVAISDHGSLALYAAMMGKPLLLASFSDTEVVPGTPMAELGRVTPRLNLNDPLPPQVQAAISKLDPDFAAYITRKVVVLPDDGVQPLLKLIYKILRLSPPSTDVEVKAAPPPQMIVKPVYSHDVTTDYVAPNKITLSRVPRAARQQPTAEMPGHHLVSDEDERRNRFFNNASIILRSQPHQDGMDAWLEYHKGHGYLLAAMRDVDGSWVVQVRDFVRYANQRFVLNSTGKIPSDLVPSVLRTAMLNGGPLPGEYKVFVGPIHDLVTIRRVQ